MTGGGQHKGIWIHIFKFS